MKKRLIAVLLAGMMLCSMTGCSMVSSILENAKESNVEDQNDDEDSDDDKVDDVNDEKTDQEDRFEDDSKADQNTENKKADALSEDLSDFIVEVDGDIYQFPCKASEFINNGWNVNEKYPEENDLEINKESLGSIWLVRENVRLSLGLENESNEKIDFQEANVSFISSFLNSDDMIIIGKNIKVGTSEEELQEAIAHSTNFTQNQLDDYLTVSYETFDKGYVKKGYMFEITDSKISEIRIQYFEKGYDQLNEIDVENEETKDQKDMTDEEIDDFFENLGLPELEE